ncbi:hypothetical protein ACLKMH_17595 [Psychromonas sp. KJ10-10]|uniref:hypothetical protein n=1 Tax=Psychromonas sp. KJ10-10 TaxID=3391823 RepID=UPI0039B5E029
MKQLNKRILTMLKNVREIVKKALEKKISKTKIRNVTVVPTLVEYFKKGTEIPSDVSKFLSAIVRFHLRDSTAVTKGLLFNKFLEFPHIIVFLSSWYNNDQQEMFNK